MPTLNIVDFSCLNEATLTLAPVTVIIGPQGSGKSVTTKLFYFLSEILNSYIQCAERGDSIDDYKRQVAKQFAQWFPPSAWGRGRSNITYTAGSFTVRVLRRTSQGRPSNEVAVTFSEWFTDIYRYTADQFERTRSGGDIEDLDNVRVTDAFERVWRVRDIISRRIERDLKEQYLEQQTFIPAGRAFFTSIGRLVAGFEQAGSLDPVTVKFARLFATIRDRNSRLQIIRRGNLSEGTNERRAIIMRNLFGGELKFEDELEFVEAMDGRKIPFTSLSSGQQELLPMWSLIDFLNEQDAMRGRPSTRTARTRRELIYIEEPEAHLFPSAQSLLMEFLVGSISSERNRRNLIITTHSPYIMSKLNVFLKAGQLARRKKRNEEINRIVPRDCWLNESQLSAFAIDNGKLKNLVDDDSLIDGRYLDQVSEDISREFSQLLKIESEI